MRPGRTARRAWYGRAQEPVPWSSLEAVFDAIFGSDLHGLERYPASLHNVHASWTDADGVEHEAETLAEVQRAYLAERTARVSFSGWRGDGKPCEFEYQPAGPSGAEARAFVQAEPESGESMIAPVRSAFPIQRRVVFISWSGEVAESVAKTLRGILEPRMPSGGEVFLSTGLRPGSQPVRTMLDTLLAADVQIPVLTQRSKERPWLLWETAASWARRVLVVPLLIDIEPHEMPGPMPHETQAVRLDHADQVVEQVVEAVGGTATKLSPEEREALHVAASPAISGPSA